MYVFVRVCIFAHVDARKTDEQTSRRACADDTRENVAATASTATAATLRLQFIHVQQNILCKSVRRFSADHTHARHCRPAKIVRLSRAGLTAVKHRRALRPRLCTQEEDDL